MPPPVKLSAAQARRIAIASQGLASPRPATVDRRHLRGVVRRTGLIQIDSVNVLARAHYLAVYSRLGGYPVGLLDRMAYRDRELFEYWGHEAALLPVELQPLMRWRMAHYEQRGGKWGQLTHLLADRPGYVESIVAELGQRGPSSAGDLAGEEIRGKENWGWNWTDTKTALEWLFMIGRVGVATRVNFERVYDLTERLVPAEILATPTPAPIDAKRDLIVIAAGCQGIGTVSDLADHFRLKLTETKLIVDELVEDGRLIPAVVQGWDRPAYLDPAVKVPRRVDARALLVPFDPLVWFRDRVERIWGMRYRIEIYTPAHKRVHGYYVLPFLLGHALVARVDLKADRAVGTLRVQAAWAEPGAPAETAAELAAELAELAAWLGLERVETTGKGDLAPQLARVLAAGG